ncbi:KH domain-containing protein [Chlamydia suis]|uniref:RNA-binding protein KhpA n=1 Tax=Chlamydia suis TaxID=83559 RepID=A0AAQ0EM33_9CHLA|nr:KH domain-containing protein [Chlamydia suis]MCI5642445.1 KH domain-containing protein [Chlamydia suis]MEB2681480.1 KH domain-containing protein [Chlamydia suis]MEB2681650.1 KH domain-containing protein [Chlamydia suis]MEB2682571.1 KH domain-containing protein [Chlamydia suis]MEB2684188.1 KH domain-containing protein [Chlamydia suis]
MKEFLAYIVKNLVDKPEEVHLKEVQGTNTIIYELTVAKGDIGKVIGKEGRTIKAIRTLLVSVASRDNVKVSLEIMEER